MRSEYRWALAFTAGLGFAVLGAKPYARLAAPCYEAVASMLALGHPWDVVSVEVAEPPGNVGALLRLRGLVYESSASLTPSFRMTGKLQVAAAAQSPLIFWTVLVLWPAGTLRRRVTTLGLGLPAFVLLEAATTVCQLMNPLAYASAVLAGTRDPVTVWECWSRFLEDGGRAGLALVAAVLTAAAAARLGLAGTVPGNRAAHGAPLS
jgi:hypothetical protein